MHFNFELILFYAILVTGAIALADIVFWAPKRRKKKGKKADDAMPLVIDYARSFFPILVVVFVLRSFLYEPFRIPSGSLEPTLTIGDFILVNKYDYGVRLPVIHNKIIARGEPQRGDIVVFRWPPNPGYDFIKRVIGVPGDTISYINKQLYINGNKITQSDKKDAIMIDEQGNEVPVVEKQEALFDIKHQIFIDPKKPVKDFQFLRVPKGMYFVMGDNRDDSADSRFWGFVPEENIVGKAVAIWMSWDSENTGVRWQRLGKRIG